MHVGGPQTGSLLCLLAVLTIAHKRPPVFCLVFSMEYSGWFCHFTYTSGAQSSLLEMQSSHNTELSTKPSYLPLLGCIISCQFGLPQLPSVTFSYACNQATACNVSNCIYHRPQIIDVYKRKAKQPWLSTWLCSPKNPLQRSSNLRTVSEWISNHKYLFLQLGYQVTDSSFFVPLPLVIILKSCHYPIWLHIRQNVRNES